jgi:catalase
MAVNGNFGSKPNYNPNSFQPFSMRPDAKHYSYRVTGLVARYKPAHPNDDFAQGGALYRKVMKDVDRDHLVSNVTGHIKNAKREIQERQVRIFFKMDAEYGDRIAKNLGFPVHKSHL